MYATPGIEAVHLRFRRIRHDRAQQGFALLATIILVAFLVLILVGLASFTRVETKVASNSQNLAYARQNALMGLNLAIGELQKNLGPDQRSSANAELVDAFFDTTANRATRHPYWVGAWNTEGGFRGWLISGNESVAQPADKADDIDPANLRVTPRSIVSSTAITESRPTGFEIQVGAAIVPAVRLAGPQTVGTTNNPAERYVFAPVRDLRAATPGMDPATPSADYPVVGRYAWWVGDEGVKANLASPVRILPPNTDSESARAERIQFVSSPGNRGFPTLNSVWERWSPDYIGDGQIPNFSATQAKILNRSQIAFANAFLADEDKLRYHEFTFTSAGVMSDSKNGGLRRDLSLAFEIPNTYFENSEFTRVLTAGEQPNAYATNHEDSGSFARVRPGSIFKGRQTKTAINYRDPSWAAGLVYRGPTFHQLRDFAQIYRRIPSPLSPLAALQSETHRPSGNDLRASDGDSFGNKRLGVWADYYGSAPGVLSSSAATHLAVSDSFPHDGRNYTRLRPFTEAITPELIRVSYSTALQSFTAPGDNPGYSRLRLFFFPYIVIHNPYNVRLQSRPLWVRTQRMEMTVNLIRTSGLPFTTNVAPPASPPTFDTYGRTSLGDLLLANNRNYDGAPSADGTSFQAIDFILSDSGAPDGSPADAIVLEPGEIRIYSLANTTPQAFVDLFGDTNAQRVMFMRSGPPDFNSGLYIQINQLPPAAPANGPALLVHSSTSFTATPRLEIIGGTSDNNQAVKPVLNQSDNEFHIIWMKLATSYDKSLPATVAQHLPWPQIRQYQFWNNSYWTGGLSSGTQAPTTLTAAAISGGLSGNKHFIGKADLYLKPASDGTDRDANFSLTTHNPRAMVGSPYASGGQGPNATRGPGTWTASLTQLDGSTPGFSDRFWGTSTDLASGGQSNVILWNVPRVPLGAIADLQHANLGRQWSAPAYAVGNSYASPFVPADQIWQSSNTVNRYWNLDDSYIFNEALFDSYFFSGVNPGLNSAGTAWQNSLPGPSATLASDPTDASLLNTAVQNWRSGITPFLNPSFVFTLPDGRGSSHADTDLALTRYNTVQTKLDAETDLRPHNAIGAYLINQGSFNVNSASIEAWRTLLAGLRGAAIDHFDSVGLAQSANADETPFPRAIIPGNDSSTGDDTQLWNGFRSLTDAEISTLATAIVNEIKARIRTRPSGASPRPFTTLGEFVNRRPGNDAFAAKGALQAALDTTLNNASSLTAEPVVAAATNFATTKQTPNETVTINYANPAALASATIAGAPQWLTQADILQRIGPRLAARSDTFTIRTYGEHFNAATGAVEGRAWLEAIVQRDPAFIDTADHPALPLAAVSAANRDFGRRFRVVSFRWLSPDDI